MKGEYKVEINSNIINYIFKINRNLTVIRGDSATGKTSLISIVKKSKRLKDVKIKCEKDLYVLEDDTYYEDLLKYIIKDKIIIIDEDHKIFNDKRFADILKNSDNYFILISRDSLGMLPYSYKEIYKLNYDKKTNTNYFKRLYKDYENEGIDIFNKNHINSDLSWN